MIWLSEVNIGTRLKDNMIGYMEVWIREKLSIVSLYCDLRGIPVQMLGGDDDVIYCGYI